MKFFNIGCGDLQGSNKIGIQTFIGGSNFLGAGQQVRCGDIGFILPVELQGNLIPGRADILDNFLDIIKDGRDIDGGTFDNRLQTLWGKIANSFEGKCDHGNVPVGSLNNIFFNCNNSAKKCHS